MPFKFCNTLKVLSQLQIFAFQDCCVANLIQTMSQQQISDLNLQLEKKRAILKDSAITSKVCYYNNKN